MSVTKIREARAEDLSTIARFNCALAAEAESKHLDPSVVRAGVEQGFARPDLCRYFVAERAGQLVGQVMITFEWSDWRAGIFWWIQSVYVRPDVRGRGIFRSLYDHISRQARAEPNVLGLRLYVDQNNERAKTIYKRLGLEPISYALYEHVWAGVKDG